jgi:hypothetical protein
MAKLEPTKASLVAHLVDFINLNLTDVVRETVRCCPDCGGRGTVGGEARPDGTVFDDGTLATCGTCSGVGAVTHYAIDFEALKKPRFGIHVEGFDVKQGVLVPKMRSKTQAFSTLVKLLGFDKAVLEVSNGASFTEALPDDAKAQYLEQLKEMAQMGLLDGLGN